MDPEHIWFCSDYHFNHELMAKMRKYSSVEEMNEDIIKIHNSYVKMEDRVFFLGDFALSPSSKIIVKLLQRLNGKITFIVGNHDCMSRLIEVVGASRVYQYKLFEYDKKEYRTDDRPIRIFLCHYPMVSWNESYNNSWHLHGHHHLDEANVEHRTFGKIMNVNFDVLHKPINLKEVIQYMQLQPDNWEFTRIHRKITEDIKAANADDSGDGGLRPP